MSNHVDVSCASCGIMFCLPEPLYNARKRDGDSFYCPNGHSLSYRPTEDQKKIKELESQLEARDRWRERLVTDLNEAFAQREDLLADLKQCPLCDYRSRRQVPRDPVAMGRGLERVRGDMVEHLTAHHGARMAAQKLLGAGT